MGLAGLSNKKLSELGSELVGKREGAEHEVNKQEPDHGRLYTDSITGFPKMCNTYHQCKCLGWYMCKYFYWYNYQFILEYIWKNIISPSKPWFPRHYNSGETKLKSESI